MQEISRQQAVWRAERPRLPTCRQQIKQRWAGKKGDRRAEPGMWPAEREKQKAISQGERADGGHPPTIIRGKGSRRVIIGGSFEGQEDIRQVLCNSSGKTRHAWPRQKCWAKNLTIPAVTPSSPWGQKQSRGATSRMHNLWGLHACYKSPSLQVQSLGISAPYTSVASSQNIQKGFTRSGQQFSALVKTLFGTIPYQNIWIPIPIQLSIPAPYWRTAWGWRADDGLSISLPVAIMEALDRLLSSKLSTKFW